MTRLEQILNKVEDYLHCSGTTNLLGPAVQINLTTVSLHMYCRNCTVPYCEQSNIYNLHKPNRPITAFKFVTKKKKNKEQTINRKTTDQVTYRAFGSHQGQK